MLWRFLHCKPRSRFHKKSTRLEDTLLNIGKNLLNLYINGQTEFQEATKCAKLKSCLGKKIMGTNIFTVSFVVREFRRETWIRRKNGAQKLATSFVIFCVTNSAKQLVPQRKYTTKNYDWWEMFLGTFLAIASLINSWKPHAFTPWHCGAVLLIYTYDTQWVPWWCDHESTQRSASVERATVVCRNPGEDSSVNFGRTRFYFRPKKICYRFRGALSFTRHLRPVTVCCIDSGRFRGVSGPEETPRVHWRG